MKFKSNKMVDLITKNIKEIDNMEEQIYIDYEELVEFIRKEATKNRFKIAIESINFVLDKEVEYLKSKGVIEE